MENTFSVNYEGTSLGEQIANELRFKIVSGKIKKDEILTENTLAKQFGTSRAPVRDSLKALSAESLLELKKTGAKVLGISLEDMKELYDVRFLLEQFALESVAPDQKDNLVMNLNILIDKMFLAMKYDDYQEFSSCDINFHEAIIKSCNHKRIFNVWSNIKKINYTALVIATKKRFEESKEEVVPLINHHKKIVDAIEKGDSEDIKKIIKEHYEDTVITVTGSISVT